MEEERSCKRLKTFDGASSSAAPGSEYQVFLSFRGEDTRKKIADHLYCRLKDAGIRTFRDNEALHVGKEIGSELLRAIQESTISVPIISKGYASSKWCLIELTHILKCSKIPGHEVYPIFYEVTPSDCKHRTGSFKEAFVQHANNVDERTVQEWKEALAEVAELKGWEKDKVADGHEGEFTEIVVSAIRKKLKKNYVKLTNELFGMDHHINEMTKLLDSGGSGVLIVGIHGMGGIGKTTIAKFMYNKLCDHFQHQCRFLEDIREEVRRNGYAELRKKLLSDGNTFGDKRVLIVLDDVENRSQLNEIIESRECFGRGSRIIVTTRNRDVFIEDEGDRIYAPSYMDFDDSLRLFCKHAFKSTHPSKDYESISREVVLAAAGLPLYLTVIGSLLYTKKSITYWEATLKKLKTIPPNEVQERLKISYEALEHGQKQIFLDIACHFIGKDKTLPIYMWEACGFFPGSGIDDLISLSLITIELRTTITMEEAYEEFQEFRMHDHLRDLGRDIVRQENPSDPGQRSRLWSPEEGEEVLRNGWGTRRVETYTDYDITRECLSSDHFKKLSHLRYFCLGGPKLGGDFKGLLPNLRWFRWWDLKFPNRNPILNFCPNKLVVLDLSGSYIGDDDWEDKIQIKAMKNLKVLNLTSCECLTKAPDLSTCSKLERLILAFCKRLTEIGGIGMLEKLEVLNFLGCRSLEIVPSNGIGRLSSLRKLDLSLTKVDTLPDDIGNLCHLRILNLSLSRIRKLPKVGIEKLRKLEVLDCSECYSLEGELPNGIWSLSSLRLLSFSVQKFYVEDEYKIKISRDLSKDIFELSNLETLEGPEKLKMQVVELKHPLRLTSLKIPFTEAVLDGVTSLVNLRSLEFYRRRGMDHIDDYNLSPLNLRNLSTLEKLEFSHISMSFPRPLPIMTFGSSSQLKSLYILRCDNVISLLDLSNCQMLRTLYISESPMREITDDDFSKLGSTWESISIEGCKSLEVLPDLSNLKKLKKLYVRNCTKLREIKGLEVLTSFEILYIYDCPLLENRLPVLSNFKIEKSWFFFRSRLIMYCEH